MPNDSGAVSVRITTNEINCYATIQRSCITAINSCTSIGNIEHAHKFMELRDWAAELYDEKIRQKISKS